MYLKIDFYIKKFWNVGYMFMAICLGLIPFKADIYIENANICIWNRDIYI